MSDNWITYRPSEDADLPAITKIYRYAVLHDTGTFEIIPPEQQEMARRRNKILEFGMPYIVAEFRGNVVGFCYAGPRHERGGFQYTAEDSLYIDFEQRGRHIGTRLLELVIDHCTALGFRKILAHIGDSKNIGSIKSHANCGYTHCGTIPNEGWKSGRWLDTLYMSRPLGEGSSTRPRPLLAL